MKYLYKSDAYCYERECRVVVPESEVQPEGITFEHEKTNGSIFRIRHHVEDPDLHVRQMVATDSRIILGPCIERPDSLRFYFETFEAAWRLVRTRSYDYEVENSLPANLINRLKMLEGWLRGDLRQTVSSKMGTPDPLGHGVGGRNNEASILRFRPGSLP